MPILDQRTVDFISISAEQTVRLGVRLGELLQPGDMVCLYGDLGAGQNSTRTRDWARLGHSTARDQPHILPSSTNTLVSKMALFSTIWTVTGWKQIWMWKR